MKFVYHGNSQASNEELERNLLFPPTNLIAVDTETVSINDKTLIGIGIAINPNEAYYVPVWPEPSELLFQVFSLLQRKDLFKVGHNYNFDIESLRLFADDNGLSDIDVWSIHDTAIMANVSALPASLHELGNSLLGNYDLFTIQDLLAETASITGKRKVTMLDADQNKVALKCCNDVRTTYGLYELLLNQLTAKTYDCYEVDRQLTGILKTIERKGLALNQQFLKSKFNELALTMEFYEDWAYEQGFSISSPAQVGMFLANNGVFLPFTESGRQYDTSEETLSKVKHPLAQEVLTYRKSQKLLSTYVEPYLNQDRGYTHFRLDLATGRLASYDRNWQNIPPDMRVFFVADRGIFTWGDMSNLEMRNIAYLTKDATLINAYKEGRSIHEITFRSIFSHLEFNKDIPEYVLAKTFNFAMVFDAEDSTLAAQCGIKLQTAKQWKKTWFETYPGVYKWMLSQQDSGSDFEETDFGRKMRIPKERGKKHANTCRINYPVQGLGADMNKRSILKMWNMGYLNENNFRIQVHDEVVLDGDYQDSFPHKELEDIHPEFIVPWEVSKGKVWH